LPSILVYSSFISYMIITSSNHYSNYSLVVINKKRIRFTSNSHCSLQFSKKTLVRLSNHLTTFIDCGTVI
ncbi:MAG: hypothetical protein ACXACA_07405, partial [Candidatus Ranarchaeia archaeon]